MMMEGSVDIAHRFDSYTIEQKKKTALLFVQSRPELFRPDFGEWLDKNFLVWIAFGVEANRVWARGRRHYSARTIGEDLRHETTVSELPNPMELKLNDHYWPDLARLYALFHPERAGFFEFRRGQSAVRAA
jgi:hypothetical protein